MKLEPIGRVANPQDLDLGPIVAPIVGYVVEDGENVEVITEIRFKRQPPIRTILSMYDGGMNLDRLKSPEQIEFMTVIVEDEDKEKFLELVFGERVFVNFVTIKEVFEAVVSTYYERPTVQPSDSSPSIKKPQATTGRAASSKAPTSRVSK